MRDPSLNDTDRTLRDHFQECRAADRRDVPPFATMWAEARRSAARRRRLRAWGPAILAAAAAGLVLLVVLTRPERAVDPLEQARAIESWSAPTDEIWRLGHVATLPAVPELTLTSIEWPPAATAGEPDRGG